MNIVVMGAGAVGGYFGGRVAAAGVPVTFLVRERRYQQLKEQGLVVHSKHGDFTLTPELARSADEIEQPDVVVLALKNYHLESAYPDIRKLVAKGAKVLPLLNGVVHVDQLAAEFGAENVLGGSCYVEATLNEAGHVLQTSPMHEIVFGPLVSMDEAWLKELEACFQRGGINVRLSASIRVDMWQKMIFLTSFSGITASTRLPIGEIFKAEETGEFFESLVQEIVQVAMAHQEGIPAETAQVVIERTRNLPQTMTSSLHRDLEKGLPLEIDSLQGAVLRLAQAKGISTPSVRAVYALLAPYREGK